MSTRFPLDVPIDIDEFKQLSLKAFDEHKVIAKKISYLEDKKTNKVSDKEEEIRQLISCEAKSKHKRRTVVALIISLALFFFIPIAVEYFGYNGIKDIDGWLKELIIPIPYMTSFLLILCGLIPMWWLWLVYKKSESTVLKWLAGICTFCFPGCFWGTIFAVILLFILNANREGVLYNKIESRSDMSTTFLPLKETKT